MRIEIYQWKFDPIREVPVLTRLSTEEVDRERMIELEDQRGKIVDLYA